MGLVLEVDWKICKVVPDKVFPDDDHYHSCWTNVFLDTSIDETIVRYVTWLAEEHGGLVGNQDVSLCIWKLIPCHTMDCLVFTDIYIVCIFRNIQVRAVWNICVVLVFTGSGNYDFTTLLCFSDSLL